MILSSFHASLPSCCCMYTDRLVECTCIFRNRAFLTISVHLAWPGRHWGESDLRSGATIHKKRRPKGALSGQHRQRYTARCLSDNYLITRSAQPRHRMTCSNVSDARTHLDVKAPPVHATPARFSATRFLPAPCRQETASSPSKLKARSLNIEPRR